MIFYRIQHDAESFMSCFACFACFAWFAADPEEKGSSHTDDPTGATTQRSWNRSNWPLGILTMDHTRAVPRFSGAGPALK
jgi:hypothetical protein